MEERRSDVAEAFELLLEALNEELRKVAENLSQVALTEGSMAAQRVLRRLSFLEQLRAQIQRLYESWQNGEMPPSEPSTRSQSLAKPETSNRDPTVEWLSGLITKPKRKRVWGGMPMPAFRPYILKALVKLGGIAREKDVLKQVEELVKPDLPEIDLEWMPTSNDYRWRKKTRWERFKMKQEGLLRDDSPRGIWELTEKGWQEARKLLENEG
ncbi:MAG: winged helix-turn-helix domain-containing protein [Armatimonadota bacterium]|nr:winged helix-turn-helix domain-containing protein [Armatimonadota bacterium]MDW8142574.1 winged helix-turn-helix domain-containing protein [Armatimonadota bacterium]